MRPATARVPCGVIGPPTAAILAARTVVAQHEIVIRADFVLVRSHIGEIGKTGRVSEKNRRASFGASRISIFPYGRLAKTLVVTSVINPARRLGIVDIAPLQDKVAGDDRSVSSGDRRGSQIGRRGDRHGFV